MNNKNKLKKLVLKESLLLHKFMIKGLSLKKYDTLRNKLVDISQKIYFCRRNIESST